MSFNYALEAFSNVDNNIRYFISFVYDAELLEDIYECITNNNLEVELTFPVVSGSFKVLSYHRNNVEFKIAQIKSSGYAIVSPDMKVKRRDLNPKFRLGVISNLFHFTAELKDGTIIRTDDMNADFIDMLVERQLEMENSIGENIPFYA